MAYPVGSRFLTTTMTAIWISSSLMARVCPDLQGRRQILESPIPQQSRRHLHGRDGSRRVAGRGYSVGAAAADYDNDGRTDLYVTGFDRNFLYHNNGDGTFTDVTAKAGVPGVSSAGKKLWGISAAWLDYDNDGKLDLFVVNYLDWSFATSRVCGSPGNRLSCSPTLYKGEPNILYHNNGDGTFTDVSEITGISRSIGKGMGVAIADYDDDGWMDIFVANDNDRNFLFKNRGGKTFDEVGVESFVAYTDNGLPSPAWE